MKGVAFCIGIAVALSACVAAVASSSGIRGTVVLADTYPVGPGSPQITPRPMSGAKLHILALPSWQEVTTAWSGKDGTFQVNVPTGRYEVRPGQNHWWPWGRELPEPALYGEPVDVTVPANGFVEITVFLSNGGA